MSHDLIDWHAIKKWAAIAICLRTSSAQSSQTQLAQPDMQHVLGGSGGPLFFLSLPFWSAASTEAGRRRSQRGRASRRKGDKVSEAIQIQDDAKKTTQMRLVCRLAWSSSIGRNAVKLFRSAHLFVC